MPPLSFTIEAETLVVVRVGRNRNVDVAVTLNVNSLRYHIFVMTPTSHMDLVACLFSKEPTTELIERLRKSAISAAEVFSCTSTTADVITTMINLLNGSFGPSGFGEGFVEVELLYLFFSFIVDFRSTPQLYCTLCQSRQATHHSLAHTTACQERGCA